MTYSYTNRNALYQVSETVGTATYAYDAGGNQTGVSNPNGTTVANVYDTANRLNSLTNKTGTGTTLSSFGYGYNSDNRRTLMLLASTGSWSYGYDNAGRLTGTTNPYSETTALAYDATNRQTQQTAGNGSVTSFGYDSADRKTDVWHQTGGGATLGRYGYTYDGAGNVSTRTDSDGSVTTFGYDGADQLTSEARTGTGVYTVGYTYDHNGNRTGKTQGGATDAYSYDAHDKLLSTSTKTYAYDNAGSPVRITSGGVVTTLAYDAEHRLTSLSGPVSNTFTYNGLGLRVGKTNSTGTYSYMTDGSEVASQVLSDGKAVYTAGLSERRGGASKFYHMDALGSTRGITSAGQTTTDALLYDAFGMTISQVGTTPTPFGFVGESGYQSDSDSGLMLLGHRYYDPSIGRFLSQDPIQDGDNWYVYVDNNPLTGIDPNGLEHTTTKNGKKNEDKHTGRRSDDPEKKDDRMKDAPPRKKGSPAPKQPPKPGRDRGPKPEPVPEPTYPTYHGPILDFPPIKLPIVPITVGGVVLIIIFVLLAPVGA